MSDISDKRMLELCQARQEKMYKWEKRFIQHLGWLGVGNLNKVQQELLREVYQKRVDPC